MLSRWIYLLKTKPMLNRFQHLPRQGSSAYIHQTYHFGNIYTWSNKALEETADGKFSRY